MKKLNYFILVKSVGFYINCLVFLNPKKAAKLAYELFSEPRDGRLAAENLPAVLLSAKKELFVHNQQEFQSYTWKGNDHIILLIHGWESNASRWEKLLPHLKKTGSTIIAIDAPAHGLSSGKEFTVPKYAATIAAFAKHVSPNVLIGHSIGGSACIYYQFLNQNKNIDKMILLGAPSDLKNLIINYCNMLSLNSKVQFHLENTFSEKFELHVDEFSGKKFAPHILTKAMIVHDIDDKIVAIEEGKKISSTWKNATFIETKGLGHSLHDEALYQKITDFLVEA